MYLKNNCVVFFIWLMAVSLCSAAMGPISSVVTDNPQGSPPYNIQSVTVGSYTVDRSQLASGTSTGTLGFNPDIPIPELDDLDLSFAWSNGETGNEFTVHMFNGELWRNSNGDDPDFFLFEAGTGDASTVAAILPGGVIGQSVTLSGGWGSTGRSSNGQSIDGAATGNGQAIVGICWAITDLLDENGNALTNDSIIEGIAVTTRNGMDPADWFAVVDRPYQAREPHPEDKATDVLREIILTWEPGWSASQHIVYFGTDFDDVNDGADSVKVGPAQDAMSYAPPGLLDFGQRYFWRVDEANGVDVWKGPVWQFEVEPYAYPLAVVDANASSTLADVYSVNRTVDRSGITVDENGNDVHSAVGTDMWKSSFLPAPASAWLQYSFDKAYTLYKLRIWNANEYGEEFQKVGIKDISIETSLDGDAWTPLGDFVVPQGPGQPGYAANEPIDLGSVEAQHVKLLIHSNWGSTPQFSISEVEFSYLPVKAREPQPEDGATSVDPEILLGWRTGRKAASHTITFSTDPETVVETTDNTYDATALDLQLGASYSWVVTEVNEATTPSIWEGDVWTFTTAEPLVLDDMESYRNELPFMIWQTWMDGSEFGTDDPANGSIVGANPLLNDFSAATGLGRGQSLPIWFDNTTVFYSEATRFVDNEDWTRHGIESLSLYFRKGADNTGGSQVYVKINDKDVSYQEPADVPPGWQTAQWVQWIIDLSEFDTDLTNVTNIMVGVKGASAKGVLYVDDIAFYKNTPASEQVVSWFEAESGTRGSTMMLFSDNGGVLGASGGQFIGTEDGSGEDTADVQDDGIATYTFSVDEAGVYKLFIRAGDFGGNSFWFRIPGSDINTAGNEDNLGWVACNFYVDGGTNILGWLPVTDYNDGDQVVEYTLTAGQHTLEVGRREDGAFLDAIAIVSVTE
ncbi:discoidin domain-containing protein [Planctomycetota bacterium]